MSPSDLKNKNSGGLSINFIYFSLFSIDHLNINNKHLSYRALCKFLGYDLSLIGLASFKSRSIGEVAKFLPTDLKEKFSEYYLHKLYTKRYSFEDFTNLIEKLGLKRTGIKGRALSPKINSNKDNPSNYENLGSEEYYSLIKYKNGYKARRPVWCGISKHKPWNAILSNLMEGKWCRLCANEEKITFSLEKLKDLAKIRGQEETGIKGKILDSKNSDLKLTEENYNKLTLNKGASTVSFWWSCENNHPPFRNNPTNIRRGQWCPLCSSMEGKFESIIRKHFKNIFGLPFSEIYMRNLNLYCNKMKINLDLQKKVKKVKFIGYNIIHSDNITP